MWQKRQQLPRSQRNPVEAWPPELLFFFRVTLLLRGLCAVLGVRVRYSAILAPYARLALLRAGDKANVALRPYAPLPRFAGVSPATPLPLDFKLRRLLAQLYREDAITGIQVAVYKDGRPAADVCAGIMGEADPRPVQPDTLFNCFSVSKGIVAMVAHLLADDALIDYDAPVVRYWPEFGSHGKDKLTVRQLLSHQAGLHREPTLDIKLQQLIDWEGMLAHLAAARPAAPPGLLTRYHILSFGWLVGGVVRGATAGQHLREVLRQRLAVPLGIEDECMLGLGGRDYATLEPRLATLCNGLFTSSDGSLPDERDIQQLLVQLREHDKARKAEEARMLQQQQQQQPMVLLNGEAAGEAVAPAPSSQQRTVPIDPNVASDEIQYPPSLLRKTTPCV